jgi:hypothetical protein
MEMVRSAPSTGDSLVALSSTTLMMNNCLHTSLCPLVKDLSQWKHYPSLQHWAISAVVRRRMLDASLVTDEADAVDEGAGGCVVAAGGRVHERYAGRPEADDRARVAGGAMLCCS